MESVIDSGLDVLSIPEGGPSLIGNPVSIGNDLSGTFYDFNRRRNGTLSGTNPSEVADAINRFLTDGWSTTAFRDVYRAERTLYATAIAAPMLQSLEAPDAFGESDTEASLWLVHYTGNIVYPEDITFRFWAYADDILAVRVDGEIAILACFDRWITDFNDATAHHWQSRAPENRQYPIGNSRAVVGDWITLKGGESKAIEILIGENQGGIFGAMLLVEVEGQTYPLNPNGQMPILPLFKTEEFSRDMIEQIYWYLQPGEGTCVGGPVFNDFHDPESVRTVEPPEVVHPPDSAETAPASVAEKPDLTNPRVWKLADGSELHGSYQLLMGNRVVLKNQNGNQIKIPWSDLSVDDREQIALLNPPAFTINFTKNSTQRSIRPPSKWLGGDHTVKIWDFKFGIRADQLNDTPYYTQPLTFEYFVVGEEVEGDHFILLDRRSETVTPPSTGERITYSTRNDSPSEVRQYRAMSGNWRGAKYGGFLVIVRDSSGSIIQHKASSRFLIDAVDNLAHVPVGRHFNKDGNRVMPPRPRKDDVPHWR